MVAASPKNASRHRIRIQETIGNRHCSREESRGCSLVVLACCRSQNLTVDTVEMLNLFAHVRKQNEQGNNTSRNKNALVIALLVSAGLSLTPPTVVGGD